MQTILTFVLNFKFYILFQALAAKEKGNMLYKEKKFEEALEEYDRAIALDSTDMTFLLNKAGLIVKLLVHLIRKNYNILFV